MKNIIQMGCLLAVLVFTSCASRKNMIYLQDMDDVHEYPVIQKYEAVIQRDDKLSIVVSCKNPELALAFNISGTGGYTIGADGAISASSVSPASTGEDKPGYLVDINGDIDFPLLGKIHAEGMTRNQLTDFIKKKIIDAELLKDPIVLVNFLNFKFSVLGEVGHVGTFNITGDRITLLEAIAMSGDLKTTSRIDRVAVIRDYGNKRRMMHVDLRTKDLFLSPAYYLHQNDIVYVEPNTNKSNEQSQRNFQYFITGFSFLTTLTTLFLYFYK